MEEINLSIQLEATVVRIETGLNPSDGKRIYIIYFGREVKVTKEMHDRMGEKAPEVGTTILLPILELSVGIEGIVPYRLESKWKISVAENGELHMTEMK
jgi:hypothetical protein